MATYLLIHGGDCTGGIWQSISHNLEVKGHQCLVPIYLPTPKSNFCLAYCLGGT